MKDLKEEDVLKLTNHAKRKAVLEAWKEWPVWWEIPETGMTVRRLNLPLGGAFTAIWYEGDNCHRFCMIGEHGKMLYDLGESILIEELQRQRKAILERREKE